MSGASIGAIDIGGTKIAVGIVDETGRILAEAHCPTAAHEGFGAAMSRIDVLLETLQKRTGEDLQGIGIGCTGPVDPLSGTIGEVDFLPGWSGCNPVAHLGQRFGVDVAMENDADAVALGELAWGAGRLRRNLLAVTVGTGIGGGIILNRTLYRGINGAHPEIGHHVIDSQGPRCFCGAHGCWEVLARGPAMVERLLQRAPPQWSGTEVLTAEFICARARAGDELARREVAEEARFLGIGIANLATLFAPEVIVLAGNVMRSADLFLPVIRRQVEQQCGLVPARSIDIAVSPLQLDAPLVGAAMVFKHRFGDAAVTC